MSVPLAFAPLPQQPKLLDRLREALQARHYSPRTEQTYRHWVKRYIFFHKVRHPAEMAEPEINAFLTHLAVKENVSASTQNQALAALLFLYRHVIGRAVGDLGEVIRARKPTRLPVVMTCDEVKAGLANSTGDKWLMASFMYGAGLRLVECLRLRVQDLDFFRNDILVRDGKGAKDRNTMLPEALKIPLQAHLKKVQGIHERNVAEGWGRVQMPTALDRKYLNPDPKNISRQDATAGPPRTPDVKVRAELGSHRSRPWRSCLSCCSEPDTRGALGALAVQESWIGVNAPKDWRWQWVVP